MLCGVIVASSKPPHVLLYLVDDMGWNLVNFGGEVPHNPSVDTPNLKALAQSGIVLDRHYTSVAA